MEKQIVIRREVGSSFLFLLTVIFIVLKLTGTITWSWWMVLSPLWIGFAIWFVVAVLVLLAILICAAVDTSKKRK